jgi:hypothetical protein
LDEAIIPLVDSEFTTPILFEHDPTHHGQRGGDGSSMEFPVKCGEQQATVLQTDEINGDFSR